MGQHVAVAIRASSDRAGDEMYRIKGGAHRDILLSRMRPSWRMIRIMRRLSRDRLIPGRDIKGVIDRLIARFILRGLLPEFGKRGRPHYWTDFIGPEMRGAQHTAMYRGQKVSVFDADKVFGFKQRKEFRTRIKYEDMIPRGRGKRHAAWTALHRREWEIEQVKELANNLDRMLRYEQRKGNQNNVRFAPHVDRHDQ